MKRIRRMIKGIVFLCTAFMVFESIPVASAAESVKDQKTAYYQQYVEMVKEVMDDHEGVTLEVAPADQFEPQDWVEPQEFKKRAIERANVKFVVEPQISEGLSTTAVKSISDSNGAMVTLTIVGNFTTQLSNDRQLFSGINSVTSSTSNGTWVQTGYTPQLIDGGRTYAFTLGGKETSNGLTSSHNVYFEFYCNANGGVG